MPKQYGLDVHIPQGLLEDLLPLAQARDLPIEKYIIEKLMFVVQTNKIKDPSE